MSPVSESQISNADYVIELLGKSTPQPSLFLQLPPMILIIPRTQSLNPDPTFRIRRRMVQIRHLLPNIYQHLDFGETHSNPASPVSVASREAFRTDTQARKSGNVCTARCRSPRTAVFVFCKRSKQALSQEP